VNFKKRLFLVGLVITVFLLGTSNAYAALPEITAAAAVVMEAKTGKIVFSKNPDEKRAPASTTKIMTGALALEKKGDSLDQIVTASVRAAATGESSIWLEEGEKLSFGNLLYGLLLRSGNDAAVAISEFVGGSEQEFVQMMNAKAQELGAKNTHFMNPNGLPNDDHYTTARDLALIARYALQNPKFAEIVSTKTKEIPWPGHEWDRQLVNTNKLLWRLEGANGVKTGYTNAAGHCLVSSADRDGQQFITVVLGSQDMWSDSTQLLEYAFHNFERVTIFRKGEKVADAPIDQGMEQKVGLLAAQDVDTVLLKGQAKDLEKKVLLKERITAPVQQGDVVGKIKIYLANQEVASDNLVAAQEVHQKTLLRSFIKEFWGIFAAMIKSFA